MSGVCLACENGDIPTQHNCFTCKAAIHISFEECSRVIEGKDEGVRNCITCHEKESGN